MPFGPERVIIADQPGHDPDERTRAAEKLRKATGSHGHEKRTLRGVASRMGDSPRDSREYEIKEEKTWPARKSASSSRRMNTT